MLGATHAGNKTSGLDIIGVCGLRHDANVYPLAEAALADPVAARLSAALVRLAIGPSGGWSTATADDDPVAADAAAAEPIGAAGAGAAASKGAHSSSIGIRVLLGKHSLRSSRVGRDVGTTR